MFFTDKSFKALTSTICIPVFVSAVRHIAGIKLISKCRQICVGFREIPFENIMVNECGFSVSIDIGKNNGNCSVPTPAIYCTDTNSFSKYSGS